MNDTFTSMEVDMINEKEFREYLQTRNADKEVQQFSVHLIDEFLANNETQNFNYPEKDIKDIRHFTQYSIAGTEDAYNRIVALARYCKFTGNDEGLKYFLTMLGTTGVLESMEERAKKIVGEADALAVFASLQKPPLGSTYEAYPAVVQTMLTTMQQRFSEKTCKKILAGNHHQIPIEKFNEDTEQYKKLGIDGYLRYRHESMLDEMEACMREDRIWYEQKITPQVLEYVRGNQEIQAGVRKGDTVYVTKIPYNPEKFLAANDPVEKRFHACHCPFVRSAIADGSVQVSPMWCYCTGGFEKMPFDVIFGKEVDVEVLETVLGGDPQCRFAIKLPNEAIPENNQN